jgi:hypothetical protein
MKRPPAEGENPTRVLYISSRRVSRTLRIQAVQHASAALMLILAAVGMLQGGDGNRWLAGFEIAAGALLCLAAGQELRPGTREHIAPIGWVDLFAGLVLLAEGLHLQHRGTHSVQYLYYGAALLMMVRSAFHPWLSGLRRLELSPEGLFLRVTPFRRLRLQWSEILSADASDYGIDLALRDGSEKRIDLRDVVNAAQVRLALQDALRRQQSRS